MNAEALLYQELDGAVAITIREKLLGFRNVLTTNLPRKYGFDFIPLKAIETGEVALRC